MNTKKKKKESQSPESVKLKGKNSIHSLAADGNWECSAHN